MKSAAKHTDQYHRWDLLSCAFKGHETYEPIGSAKARIVAAELHITTRQGDAWRCLRCGTYIIGSAKMQAPLSKAPIVPRGKAVRAGLILRVLAVERLIRGLLLALLTYGILKFRSSQYGLHDLLQRDLPALQTFTQAIGYNLDNSSTLRLIERILSLGQGTLIWAAVAAGVYSALQLIEATGLWLMKRWGEYFAAVATSLFLPLEIIELIKELSILKALTLLLNIAAVVYLVYSKRLFSLRGGYEAYESDLQGENLIEIVQATKPDVSSKGHAELAESSTKDRH